MISQSSTQRAVGLESLVLATSSARTTILGKILKKCLLMTSSKGTAGRAEIPCLLLFFSQAIPNYLTKKPFLPRRKYCLQKVQHQMIFFCKLLKVLVFQGFSFLKNYLVLRFFKGSTALLVYCRFYLKGHSSLIIY